MLIIGLTGSIAMGKSHVARLFRAYGVPVFDSDAAVHDLFRPGGAAVLPVRRAFTVVADELGGIDRRKLGGRVFGDRVALARLEAIVHPLVRQAQQRFLEAQCRSRRALVVLDVPLLLEGDGSARVDCVAVVSTAGQLQRDRALRRPGMTEAKLHSILVKQLPDHVKRRRADFVISSGHDRGAMVAHVGRLIGELRAWPPRAWSASWLQRQRAGGEQ